MENAPFPISSWSEEDKPREKLMLKGKSALSDAELIAILIGSGSRNESAVDLSKRMLASVVHNLNALGKLSLSQLMQFKGIGEAKAITIVAALDSQRGGRRNGGLIDEVRDHDQDLLNQVVLPLMTKDRHMINGMIKI